MAALNYTQRKKLGRGIFHVVVIFLCFLMTYPLLYMVFSSFKTAQDIFQRPNSLFPQEFTLQNFPNGWRALAVTPSPPSLGTPSLSPSLR